MINRTHPKNPSFLKYAEYQRLWRMVEGAVVDTMKCHPEYFTEKAKNTAVTSITKRVVGMIIHNAKRTQAGGRLGGCNGNAEHHIDVTEGDAGATIAEGSGRCNAPTAPTKEGRAK